MPAPIWKGNLQDQMMRHIFRALIRNVAVVSLLGAVMPHFASPTGVDPVTDPLADPAPCVAATAAGDDDKIIAVCGALIDNDKTVRADRVRALIARRGGYHRKGD